MPSMYMTKDWLIAHSACAVQVRLFEQAWPQGGEISEATLHRAHALGLNLDWLAAQLPCSTAAEEAYEYRRATAWATHVHSIDAAWATYVHIAAAAKAAYDGSDAAWRAYDDSRAAAWTAYLCSLDEIWTAYVDSRTAARIESLLQSLAPQEDCPPSRAPANGGSPMLRALVCVLLAGLVLGGVAQGEDRCVGTVVLGHCTGSIVPDYMNPRGHPSDHFDEQGRGLHDSERPGVYRDGWRSHFNLTPRIVPGHGLRYHDQQEEEQRAYRHAYPQPP